MQAQLEWGRVSDEERVCQLTAVAQPELFCEREGTYLRLQRVCHTVYVCVCQCTSEPVCVCGPREGGVERVCPHATRMTGQRRATSTEPEHSRPPALE